MRSTVSIIDQFGEMSVEVLGPIIEGISRSALELFDEYSSTMSTITMRLN